MDLIIWGSKDKMALKNKPLSKNKDKSDFLAPKELKKMEKKMEEIEDIYFGELALSRKDELHQKKYTEEEIRKEFGL